jgi:hypothetical protein
MNWTVILPTSSILAKMDVNSNRQGSSTPIASLCKCCSELSAWVHNVLDGRGGNTKEWESFDLQPSINALINSAPTCSFCWVFADTFRKTDFWADSGAHNHVSVGQDMSHHPEECLFRIRFLNIRVTRTRGIPGILEYLKHPIGKSILLSTGECK